MRVLTWVISVLILLVLQAGVLSAWGLFQANLILLFLVLALLAGRVQGSLTVAIAGGLMLDFLSGTKDGTITFALLGTWWVMYVVFEGFVKREPNVWTFALSVIASTWIYAAALLLVNWIYSWFNQSQAVAWGNFLINYLLWATLFNLALSYLVWKYIIFVEYFVERLARKK